MAYFVYENIIGTMSTDTFKFCVNYLYDYMEYKYIPKNRVRKIDLMEFMNHFDIRLSEESKAVGGYADLYLYILKKYLLSVVKCADHSRAENYKTKAISIVDNYKSNNKHGSEIYDALTIFVSLIRVESVELEKINTVEIIDRTFDAYLEDADLIKRLYNCDGLVPQNIYDKKIFGENVSYNREKELRKFFYFISILYLGMCLEERGLLGRGK